MQHTANPSSADAQDELDMLDALLATEYEHIKQAPYENSPSPSGPQGILGTPTAGGLPAVLSPRGPMSHSSSPWSPTTQPMSDGPAPQRPPDPIDEEIEDMYEYSDWPSVVLQLDQALRKDEEGKALIEVLQTCKSVLAHKSEPKVRMQDRAVQASQGVLDHLLASQMASAVSQAGHALPEHGTLRSKGRGHVVQDLDACVQGCAPQDLFPLAYFLASCVSSLVEKAQEVRADIEMMSSNWRVLQEKLQSACGVVNILASNSPPCGDAFDLGAWMKGLVPEPKHRGTTSSKFSDGIAANAVTNDGELPVPKQFYPQDYRPPRFLEALKGLLLDDADQYRVCGECDLITKDFEQHCEKSGHGLSEARHPTMDDVVRKAVQFGKKCRSDPGKQQICQLLKDDDDIHALYVYTLETEIYSKMNAAMRNDIPSPEAEKWRPVIYHIHRALRNLPSHSLTQLYRGIDCKVQNYDEGRFILWHQFSSSTVNPDIVKDFTAEGGSIFILRPSEASQGHLIDFLSEFEKEKEVLFAANTWFRVQQKLKDGTKRFLAQHMGIEWEVMKEIDVYELHEVTEDLARQEHAAQQQKAVQLQEGAQLLGQRASKSLVAHVLEGNAEACVQDVEDGADVQQHLMIAEPQFHAVTHVARNSGAQGRMLRTQRQRHAVLHRQRRAVVRTVRNSAANILRRHFPADISLADAGFTGLNLRQLKSELEQFFGIACLSRCNLESTLDDIAEHINAVLEGATRRCVYGEDDKVADTRTSTTTSTVCKLRSRQQHLMIAEPQFHAVTHVARNSGAQGRMLRTQRQRHAVLHRQRRAVVRTVRNSAANILRQHFPADISLADAGFTGLNLRQLKSELEQFFGIACLSRCNLESTLDDIAEHINTVLEGATRRCVYGEDDKVADTRTSTTTSTVCKLRSRQQHLMIAEPQFHAVTHVARNSGAQGRMLRTQRQRHAVLHRQRRAVVRTVRNSAANILRQHFPADISLADAGFTGLNLRQLKSELERLFGIACLSRCNLESTLDDIAEHINAVLEGATRRCVYGEDDKVADTRTSTTTSTVCKLRSRQQHLMIAEPQFHAVPHVARNSGAQGRMLRTQRQRHAVLHRQRRAVVRTVRNSAANILRQHFPADVSLADAGFTGLNLRQLKSEFKQCFGITCVSGVNSESTLDDIAEHINAVLEGAVRRSVYCNNAAQTLTNMCNEDKVAHAKSAVPDTICRIPVSLQPLTHATPRTVGPLKYYSFLYPTPLTTPCNKALRTNGVAIRVVTAPHHPCFGQYGLFAGAQGFAAGATAGFYTGVVQTKSNTNEDSCYLARLPTRSRTLNVDAALFGNETKFINDAKGVGSLPNVALSTEPEYDPLGLPVVRIKCTRAVGAHEELLMDYGDSYWASWRKLVSRGSLQPPSKKRRLSPPTKFPADTAFTSALVWDLIQPDALRAVAKPVAMEAVVVRPMKEAADAPIHYVACAARHITCGTEIGKLAGKVLQPGETVDPTDPVYYPSGTKIKRIAAENEARFFMDAVQPNCHFEMRWTEHGAVYFAIKSIRDIGKGDVLAMHRLG